MVKFEIKKVFLKKREIRLQWLSCSAPVRCMFFRRKYFLCKPIRRNRNGISGSEEIKEEQKKWSGPLDEAKIRTGY